MRAYKVGKIVTVNLAATTFALGSPTALISFAGVLPAGYRPSAEVIFPALFMSGGIWDTGLIGNIKISAAGSIVLGQDNDAASSDFDGSRVRFRHYVHFLDCLNFQNIGTFIFLTR
jgi:hypothetical protein